MSPNEPGVQPRVDGRNRIVVAKPHPSKQRTVHTEKHLFERLVSFPNLYRSYVGASAGKRDRNEVREFEYHLETRLWDMQRELEAGRYEWGPYRTFIISDPKRRVIRAAAFRDRVVHHALFNVVAPVLAPRFISDTYACIPGRGTHRAVERYLHFVRARRGDGYALHCDVRAYFDSVDHDVLVGLLRRCVADRRALSLLDSLIRSGASRPGKGMPIGNLTSQLFANLYLDPLDHFAKEKLRARQYLRYMDDFLFVLGNIAEARCYRGTVRTFLDERLKLELNPRRVVIAPLHCPRDILGYVHHRDGRLRVRRRSVRRLWRRLRVLEQHLAAGQIAWPTARASVASWFGLAKHANAFALSRSVFGQRDVRNLGRRLLVQACSQG
jgi:retron-type reverse transcriptase